MSNGEIIKNDILRYKKNKVGSSLALLGLVFNCLYFMLLYSFNSPEFYIIEIGVSVLLNLVLLLACFLSSESVKVYNRAYCIVLLVIAVLQIVRIWGLPLMGLNSDAFKTTVNSQIVARDYFGFELSKNAAFTILVVWLVLSSGSLIASAVYSLLITTRYLKHVKAVESGEIDMDAVLAQENAGSGNGAVQTAADSELDKALKNTEKELDSEDKEVQ